MGQMLTNTKLLTKEYEALRAEVAKLKRLLGLARCPDTDCIGGHIPIQTGEEEYSSSQCQWCYEKEQAL